MAPQFNLLKGRIKVGGFSNWGFASFFTNEGQGWCGLWVRQGTFSHYQIRRVKGFIPLVEN